jgi:hypothetical protein
LRSEESDHALAVVEGERGQVDEMGDVGVEARGLGDHGAAVAVADQYGGPLDQVEDVGDGSCITVQIGERSGGDAVSGQVDRVRRNAAGVECGLQCGEAPRSVPRAMDEHDRMRSAPSG